MSLELHTLHIQDAFILLLQGRLDSITSTQVESEILSKIEQSTKPVILDLEHLDYVASAGLRIILMAAKRARAQKIAFALCSLQAQVHNVFEISGFLKIITVYENRDQALEASIIS